MLPFLKIKIESSQNNKLLLEGKAVLQLTYERKRLNQSFYYVIIKLKRYSTLPMIIQEVCHVEKEMCKIS